MHVYICVPVCAHVKKRDPKGLEKHVRPFGAGVAGSCQPSDMGIENHVRVLFSSTTHLTTETSLQFLFPLLTALYTMEVQVVGRLG